MIIIAIVNFCDTGFLSASSLLVLISFSSFLILWFLIADQNAHIAWESIRVSFIAVLCTHFAIKSNSSTPYLLLCLVMLSFLIANGCFVLLGFIAPQSVYIALTIAEVIIFAEGIYKTRKAKANDSILNDANDLYDRFRRNDGEYRIFNKKAAK